MSGIKLACVSDGHGHLPDVPKCDALILAGDYCLSSKIEAQFAFLRDQFQPWLKKINVPTFGVAGNHDLIFEEAPERIPQLELSWNYLQDSGIEWNGFKIWGSPWQPRFYDWAFNASEDELAQKWSLIPDDTDILILHGPPRGYGDFSTFGNEHTGSPSLLERILQIKPKLVVAGHIHSGHGVYNIGETVFVNAAQLDDAYQPVYKPVLVEINKD